MTDKRKKGFTLTELIVVLVIMAIILAISVPLFVNYWRRAEFRKNESNARTVYLAAESKLTYYRSSGQWDQFKKQVKAQGITGGFDDNSDLHDRIYAITLDQGAYGKSGSEDNLVLKLIEDYIYDAEMLEGAIGIEIDIESGEVYSAFYATKCKGLNYAAQDANDYLTMRQRDYESRRKRLLGYYSAEDTVNIVNLDPVRLRITTISLQNSEKLSLNWSSNAGSNADVDYEVSFYDDKDDSLLFSLVVSPYDMMSDGWSGKNDTDYNLASIEVKDKDGKSQGEWTFPIRYKDNKYDLVLDAMMSAKVQALIASKNDAQKLAYEKNYSTSIERLAEVAPALAAQMDMYATVKAVQYSGSAKPVITQEYRASEYVSSNTSNTLYADKSKSGDVKISTFRHLSNIRYYEASETVTFELINKDMDWASVGTGVYDLVDGSVAGRSVQTLSWKENSKDATVDFPTIPELSKTQALTGKSDSYKISNIHIGGASVINDTTAAQLSTNKSEYIGIFGEIEGTVEKLTLQDPKVTFDDSTSKYTALKGVGVLCGRSSGSLLNLTVKVKNDDTVVMDVSWTNSSTKTAGAGIIAGVLASEKNSSLAAVTAGEVSDISVAGQVNVTLPAATGSVAANAADNYAYGIGGIAGYAKLANTTDGSGLKLQKCENHADISGNVFTGGIVGKIDGNFSYTNNEELTTTRLKAQADILDCTSDGLILCTADVSDTLLQGHYFGGIAGYAGKTLIYNVSSASGRARGFSFSSANQNLLKGDYVGGIVGFGMHSLLNNCSTGTNGYILGADYVGGIAGGLGGEVKGAIRTDAEVAVTTNGSYVIGKNYVGGIVGRNNDNVVLKNCINNGVVAGYEKYIGGIVGYNESATIEDCASYLSDYNRKIFDMVVNQWQTTGDYVGGIAGYNNGEITFSEASEAITVKSVSSLVAGKNYIGGIVGFNDVDGTLDVHYTLIGGRIYATGDCVGGAFGFNASTSTLTKSLTVKPSSVEGRYYVGGVIGANVVDLTSDTTMDQFKADNTLGKITGQAYVGGVIGYQRTYTHKQAGLASNAALQSVIQSGNIRLLPGLSDGNIPASAEASQNSYTLTVTMQGNDASSLAVAINNIPVSADVYSGGVIGYCEKSSKLLIENCRNAGNMIKRSDDKEVSLYNYLCSAEVLSPTAISSDESVNLHFVGGLMSVNLANQEIRHCSNTGSMSGYSGIGGIVGLNVGKVDNCYLSEHFGNASLDYLGGIAGINLGRIENCSTDAQKTISGSNNVGGIVGWNLTAGRLSGCTSSANINASGSYVGGIAGRNRGTLEITADADSTKRTISGLIGIGGIVGYNEAGGRLQPVTRTGNEVVAVGSSVTVSGNQSIGGIVGMNEGTLGANSTLYLTCQAKRVKATMGDAGGIVGRNSGDIYKAINRSDSVTADTGLAGGITAANDSGNKISDCTDYGNVRSSDGHAGGIVAKNSGTIQNCTVANANGNIVEIYSLGVSENGAVAAVNTDTGLITGSAPAGDVKLAGNAVIFGAVTGTNQGTVLNTTLNTMPEISSRKSNLTVGGVAGKNFGTVTTITANLAFDNLSDILYLGGIVGSNGDADTQTGLVSVSSFTGTINEKRGSAGNCYGGIAGINFCKLTNCSVGQITMSIRGVYTATSTSTTEQKESLASHAGGIAGKNESLAMISGCTLEDNPKSVLTAEYGMLGGVTGFNKGTISMSGSNKTSAIMSGVTEQTEVEVLNTRATAAGLSTDTRYINWNQNLKDIDSAIYSGSNNQKPSDNRLRMYMTSNGNIGGVTAYNSTTGAVNTCVSGNWFIENKSNAIGVGTGGIIGMNESEQNMNYLVNGAFVGRYISSGDTNRFAGGIIGNQNNSTTSEWTLAKCINYGSVYCYNSHYSGGIMGQWTGTGGTIEQCRNYGMLQTTYGTDWVGASAGIVAQLYHANEGNEYNIISCGNYGSVYTRTGEDAGNKVGANDSAGILGNITTYYSNSVANAQQFCVQILDCVNASGVKIYSGSMASGIFGFLSSDNPSRNSLQNSTAKVMIRIERCRNFAQILKGYYYYAGIFGDRYGTDAWKNYTIVKDNFSLNLNNSYYWGTQSSGGGYPIYAKGIGLGSSQNMKAENRTQNYHIEGIQNWGYTNVRLNENVNSTGSGSAGNGYYEADLNTRYTHNTFFMYDQTAEKYFLGVINIRTQSNMTTINGSSSYIDEYGYIRNRWTNAKLGEVWFYVDNQEYNNSKLYNSVITDSSVNNVVFTNARESSRRLEGIVDADGKYTATGGQILAPQKVEANVSNGQITVNIIPKKLPGSDNILENRVCDPFMYLVKVSNGQTEFTHRLYTENGSFNIPQNMSGEVTVQVQAVSMYDDVDASEWVTVGTSEINKTLPDPDIRVEVVDDASADRSHAYKFSLNNLDEYDAVDENGNLMYEGWQVKVNVQRVGEIVLSADKTEAIMHVSDENNYVYQMVAQATMQESSQTLTQASKEVSTSVSLPFYRPSITLKTWTPQLAQKVTLSGDTLDELAINVELDAGRNKMNTPPIYRVELLGTYDGENNIVFANQDVLTVSEGKASAIFTNLPEYISEATNLHVRIWYAASGLGPVYTYHTVENDTEYNIKQLMNIDEDGNKQWMHIYSNVIDNKDGYFTNYQNTTSTLWAWLTAPVLEDTDTMLQPTLGDGGEIYYTFTWDKDSQTSANKYRVALTGIDEDGKEIVIDVSDAYTSGNTLKVDGSDWNYSQVKLKVTRIGDASKKQIGLSSTGTYLVKQRLARPAQPMVSIIDENELNYQISWSPIVPETGCESYQIYVRAYDGDTLGKEQKLGNQVLAGQMTNNAYSIQTDLEGYAGQRIVVYVVAEATANGSHLNSVDGVSYELQVPERLAKPNVKWSVNWTYDKSAPVTVDAFTNGGLNVALKAASDSIPPGGSAYLLKAYVYDSAASANQATDTDPGNYVAAYPEDNLPVQMDMINSTEYNHDISGLSIQYAGKWIVFYARISSGGGNISSKWAKSADVYRLPYVKLDAPEIASGTQTSTVKVMVTDTPEVPSTERSWTINHTTLNWTSVDCADMFAVDFAGRVTDAAAQTGKRDVNAQIRILEYTNGTVDVQQYVYRKKADAETYEWVWVSVAEETDDNQSQLQSKTHTYILDNYGVTISSRYQAANGALYYYDVTLTAQLTVTANDDGTFSYVLALPDTETMITDDNISVTHEDFRITDSVVFKSDVQLNLNSSSSSYVQSDDNEIKWNN